MVWHFQYKVEVFFKEIILDGPFGKTKYYAILIEFQENVANISIRLYESNIIKYINASKKKKGQKGIRSRGKF